MGLGQQQGQPRAYHRRTVKPTLPRQPEPEADGGEAAGEHTRVAKSEQGRT